MSKIGMALSVAHVFATQRGINPVDITKVAEQQVMLMHSLKQRDLLKQVVPKKSKATKLQAARDLLKTNKVQRSEAIQLLIDQLGLTKAGATTYYAKIRSSL